MGRLTKFKKGDKVRMIPKIYSQLLCRNGIVTMVDDDLGYWVRFELLKDAPLDPSRHWYAGAAKKGQHTPSQTWITFEHLFYGRELRGRI